MVSAIGEVHAMDMGWLYYLILPCSSRQRGKFMMINGKSHIISRLNKGIRIQDLLCKKNALESIDVYTCAFVTLVIHL